MRIAVCGWRIRLRIVQVAFRELPRPRGVVGRRGSRVREGGMHLNRPLLDVVHIVLDATEDWVGALSENRTPPDTARALRAIESALGMEPEAPAIQTDSPLPARPFRKFDTVRVNTETLDRLLRSMGQLVAETLRQELVTKQLRDINHEVGELEKEWERVRTVSGAPLRRLVNEPGLARLARYIELIERQVHSLSGQTRAALLFQQRSSWSLRQLGEELQKEVKQARMVPAESVYEGFHKMVRDLARDMGKDVEFRVSGLEVEADRLVLEALKDPLMHLLRNAITHGIEIPTDRMHRGKNPVGRVTLRMEAQGNRLRLVVEDDGRGVNLKRVAEVALQRGLLTEAEAAAPSARELAGLIFQPGFSTSDVVTELSGRGMGLSVVHEAVQRLQGDADVQPTENEGTSIRLSVPLSISTHRLLLVACQGQTFCMPAHAIEQLCRIKVKDLQTVEGRPVVCLEGKQIPLMTLASALELGESEAQKEILPVMVLRSAGRRMAVVVDDFLAERDALIKDLGISLPSNGKLAGGILNADGSVALVLNPAGIMAAFQQSSGKPAFAMTKPAVEERGGTILVVDDSITTRTLERSILEAHGYQVRVAVDGLEALEQLRARPADLVIADIQMPRMDGFTLLAEIKKDQRLAQTPVIIVSSLERREEQERGLALGADAYIVKRKFDQQELLEAIRQIL